LGCFIERHGDIRRFLDGFGCQWYADGARERVEGVIFFGLDLEGQPGGDVDVLGRFSLIGGAFPDSLEGSPLLERESARLGVFVWDPTIEDALTAVFEQERGLAFAAGDEIREVVHMHDMQRFSGADRASQVMDKCVVDGISRSHCC
jgi:hypothetical protein